MAILYDDFQGYPVGTTGNFGPWIWGGFFAPQIIDSPFTGVYGKSKSCLLPFTSITYTDATFYPSVSIFVAYRAAGLPNSSPGSTIFGLGSGVQGLAQVFINPDATIGIRDGHGNNIAIGFDYPLTQQHWQFLQFNFTFIDDGGFVRLIVEAGINEVSVLSGTYLTSFPTSGLAGLGFNTFGFVGGGAVAEITIDTLKSIGDDPNPNPARVIRNNQDIIESPTLPSTAIVRVNQAEIELPVLPTTAKLYVNQGLIELVVGVSAANKGKWKIYEA